jgi:hypothetical protein
MSQPVFVAKKADTMVYFQGMSRPYEIALVNWLTWLKANAKDRYTPITGYEKVIKGLDKNDDWEMTPFDKDETHRQMDTVLSECEFLRNRLSPQIGMIQDTINEISRYYQSFARPRRFGDKKGYVENIMPTEEFELPTRIVNNLVTICDIAKPSMANIASKRSAFLGKYQELRNQVDEVVKYPSYVWNLYGELYTTIEKNFVATDIALFDCEEFLEIILPVMLNK